MINIETLATKSIPELNELLAAVQYVIGAKTLGLPIATANIVGETESSSAVRVIKQHIHGGRPKKIECLIGKLQEHFGVGTVFSKKNAANFVGMCVSVVGREIDKACDDGVLMRHGKGWSVFSFGMPSKFSGVHEGRVISQKAAARHIASTFSEPFTKKQLFEALGATVNSSISMAELMNEVRKIADLRIIGSGTSHRYLITKRDTRVSKVVADIIKLQVHDTTVHPSVHDLACKIGASRELTQQGLDVMRAQLAFDIRKRVDGLAFSSPAHE